MLIFHEKDHYLFDTFQKGGRNIGFAVRVPKKEVSTGKSSIVRDLQKFYWKILRFGKNLHNFLGFQLTVMKSFLHFYDIFLLGEIFLGLVFQRNEQKLELLFMNSLNKESLFWETLRFSISSKSGIFLLKAEFSLLSSSSILFISLLISSPPASQNSKQCIIGNPSKMGVIWVSKNPLSTTIPVKSPKNKSFKYGVSKNLRCTEEDCLRKGNKPFGNRDFWRGFHRLCWLWLWESSSSRKWKWIFLLDSPTVRFHKDHEFS